ncbi:unnamed protein product [Cylicostephanus goldi]|uniref:Uncharacterized protein n=1 Tax=Cylicostephanus goldi TaxID=71465 RepID=A0A3P6SEY9_CYLGO|nr:unnamed protein product [Cylicostephanus goldi]
MANILILCTILLSTPLQYAVHGHNHHPYIRVHYGPPYRPVVSLVSLRHYMYPCAKPMPSGQLRAVLVAADFDRFTVGGNIGDAKDAPENSMAALKLVNALLIQGNSLITSAL